MSQNYKAVYFTDYPAETSKQKSLTIAFGKKTSGLYEVVQDLSSTELRQLLGTDSYQDIVTAAQINELPINTYCLRQLKHSIITLKQKQAQLTLQGVDPNIRLFDPLTVTFKGGAKEPFIRWYPYLEGYSPQFVEAIIERFAPQAQRILDPFAGTATTAFTVAQLGKAAYFCEVNPLLQFISLTKIRVRRLSRPHRTSLATQLTQVADSIHLTTQYQPDRALQKAYENTFGDSEFFDAEVYQQVLKVRSWIDEIALTKPLLADLITVATLAALVPVSRMKRAGDLRYKRPKELERQPSSLSKTLLDNLNQIARDIQSDVNGLQTEPRLLCENALSLSQIPHLAIDAVITSPPYVNGTNYFRNTKIELWFLRCLNQKSDLASFRVSAITAGINDVTVAKVPEVSHPDVQKVVSILEENAYDSRIPRMIKCYFEEMTDVFRAISKHLTAKATVAIDIGDSNYAGVHVPVDQLLATCLHDLGFNLRDNIILRERHSRGGALLKQVLLVFQYNPEPTQFYIKTIIQPWSQQWEDFKSGLPHQKKPYSKRNWGHIRHSLCSYPGKLKPAIAHHLVKMFVPEKGIVLDPFAGVGTIPFEAALQGKRAYGFDISPAAFIIANAKVKNADTGHCLNVLEKLLSYINNNTPTEQELAEVRNFGFNGKVFEYYHEDTLREILLARRYFQSKPPRTPDDYFVLASLLHVLHGNRPYALSRRSHPITPYKPTGPFEYRSLIHSVTEKVKRTLEEELPENFRPGKMFLQDAVQWWPREINELDAIITSPPFFDSTRYYLANWLRLWFSGWSQKDFDTLPLGFVDERQKQSFDIYIPILRQARERLKPNGVLVFHLGKSKKCDMAEQLQRISRKWFRSADMYNENVEHCESHGVRDKGTVTSHQYLVVY